jgi:hypothetical protein
VKFFNLDLQKRWGNFFDLREVRTFDYHVADRHHRNDRRGGDMAAHPSRLRSRNVGAKRSLASREFALGIEALERFVRREPLRLTHGCVFGVLALESEPIDPRL